MDTNQNQGRVFTFDMIPTLMANLLEDNKRLITKIDNLTKKVMEVNPKNYHEEDKRMDVTEAQEYIPGHPAVQTIYGWTSNNIIPYHKVGKRIYFLKSELDKWLQKESFKSDDDLMAEARAYVNSKHYKNTTLI